MEDIDLLDICITEELESNFPNRDIDELNPDEIEFLRKETVKNLYIKKKKFYEH